MNTCKRRDRSVRVFKRKQLVSRDWWVLLLCLSSLRVLAGDWNCAQTSGVYTRNQDCIMSSQVTLGGSLSVTGGTQLTWEELEGGGALVTITAASGSRHFSVGSGSYTLTLKWLKLTGGNVDLKGGSIFVTSGSTIHAELCWFDNNKINGAEGGCINSNGVTVIKNTVMTNNIAGDVSASLFLYVSSRFRFTNKYDIFHLSLKCANTVFRCH